MNARVGGRFVQVASTPAPGAPFGRFEHVSIVGYGPLEIERGNIYFAAVNTNPADAGRTLLGLFPVLLDGRATISAAVSCDGTRFSSLWPVYNSRAAKQGRTTDHPVDGLVVRGEYAYAYVHRDVPAITPDARPKPGQSPPPSRIVRLTVPLKALKEFTDRERGAGELRKRGMCGAG